MLVDSTTLQLVANSMDGQASATQGGGQVSSALNLQAFCPALPSWPRRVTATPRKPGRCARACWRGDRIFDKAYLDLLHSSSCSSEGSSGDTSQGGDAVQVVRRYQRGRIGNILRAIWCNEVLGFASAYPRGCDG